ncbi:MAG TPA: DMT family transporter [Solirubrobacteraceae bacterium]|nr:DMT family transporter [Solirubrobacteraceae bacterium]
MGRHTVGSLIIAASALSWGVIGVIVRKLPMPALTIVGFRVLLSAVSVAVILVVLRRWELLRPPPWPVLALGALLAAHWGLYFAAIKQTSVASAVLITYAGPIVIAMIAPLLIGERVPPLSIAALAVSAAGIALISLSGGSGDAAVRPAGVALAVGAAISMAVLIVLLKRFSARIDPMRVVVYLDGIASALLWPALVFPDYRLSGAYLGYLALLGVVLTGLTGILYVLALRWVPATTVGVLSYLEPVSAVVLAAVLLGQRLTTAVVVGGAAIVAAGVAVVVATPDPIAAAVEEPVPSGEPLRAKARA